MKPVPYVGFSNQQLAAQPPLAAGDIIDCPACGGKHAVEAYGGKEMRGVEGPESGPEIQRHSTTEILSLRCANETFLVGINGKSIIGISPFKTGNIGGAPVCRDCKVAHGGCMLCDSQPDELAERGHRKRHDGSDCRGVKRPTRPPTVQH